MSYSSKRYFSTTCHPQHQQSRIGTRVAKIRQRRLKLRCKQSKIADQSGEAVAQIHSGHIQQYLNHKMKTLLIARHCGQPISSETNVHWRWIGRLILQLPRLNQFRGARREGNVSRSATILALAPPYKTMPTFPLQHKTQKTNPSSFPIMSTRQPTATEMRVLDPTPLQSQQPAQQYEQVLRLRGGGNTVADCLA